MPSKIYDIHPHIISQDTARYPYDPLGGIQSEWSRDRPVSAEQLVKAMDEAGIAKSAIVQASTSYGYDNSYVTDSIAQYPDRFTGVGTVDLKAPDAIEKIDYWVTRGIAGLRLFTIGTTITKQMEGIDDERTFEAWDYAGEKGLSICLQMSPDAFAAATTMIKRFPKVKVLIDHHGRADITDGPPYAKAQPFFELAQFENVYVKLTPRSADASVIGQATPETFFPRMVKEFGADRLAWGSNYPANEGSLESLLKRCLDRMSSLSENDLEWIFWKTAEQLYPALGR
jgi:predicted TIM-barrel fold metal-dependent hydrolase